jgi:hypothetical protein
LHVPEAEDREPRVVDTPSTTDSAEFRSAEFRLAGTARSQRGEQRYAPGERRTSAQPLTASWRPESENSREQRGASDSGIGRFVSAYGWRVYAIPVLVVLSVLVLVNTTQSAPGGASTNSASGAPQNTLPTVTEQPATPISAGTGTAVSPPGGNYPQAGAGTWRVLPGSGPIVGKAGGRVYHYQIRVEDGVDQSYYQGDDAFVGDVTSTLSDPRSWIAAGTIDLQRVDGTYPTPDFTIDLTTPNTDHRPDLCGFQIQYEGSCWVTRTHQVIINIARWVRGALAFNGDLGLYRQYAINHETGHAFGNFHVGCATNGGLAPVMMEQSFGVSDDYVYDVNDAEPANRGAVKRDGKVCLANAWPYPQGPTYAATAPPAPPTG